VKSQLCEAFCADLRVERVPVGWLVATPFKQPDGSAVVFFIVTVENDVSRLEDDGAQVALLEMAGVSLDKGGARHDAFMQLLSQHDATYDSDDGVICSANLPNSEIPKAAIKFMALMMRVHDLALLTVERVKQSWRDDAVADLHRSFDGIAKVEENALVGDKLGGVPADVVIRAFAGNPPVAVILGTSNAKGLQALVLKMEMEKYQHQDYPVVLLVERAKDNPLAESTYALSQSRLNGVHTYRNAEVESMQAIGRLLQPHGTVQ
jgi:hypothetical protein